MVRGSLRSPRTLKNLAQAWEKLRELNRHLLNINQLFKYGWPSAGLITDTVTIFFSLLSLTKDFLCVESPWSNLRSVSCQYGWESRGRKSVSFAKFRLKEPNRTMFSNTVIPLYQQIAKVIGFMPDIDQFLEEKSEQGCQSFCVNYCM